MLKGRLREGVTFDDVLLIPAKSEVLLPSGRQHVPHPSHPHEHSAHQRGDGYRHRGQAGDCLGAGGAAPHRNMSINHQVAEVDKVKRSESGMIVDPITMGPDQSVREALDIMEKYRISGIPITKNGRLVGILTNRDLRFETDLQKKVSS